MKRALVVLLALVMGAGLLFAADPVVKWQGWVRSGVGLYTQETGTTFKAYDYDRVGGDRIRLAYSYTSADGNLGFYSRLSIVDGDFFTTTAKTAGFHRLYGWGKLFGGMLMIKAGILDDYSLATADWNGFGNNDGRAGIYLLATPMAGLNIGYFQQLPYGGAVELEKFYNPVKDGKGSIAGLSYDMKGIGKVSAGVIADYFTGSAAYFGFNLTAVKGLTAILEGKYQFNGATTPLWLEQNVGYAMGALTAGARIGENYNGTDFYWGVEPTVSYKLNSNLSVGVIGNVYNNKSQTFMSPIDAGVVDGGVVGDLNFGVGASVTYTMGGVRLVLGDYYAAATGAGNIVYLNVDLSF